MGYPTKNIDTEIRDFLIASDKDDLPEEQTIAREQPIPRKYPVREVRMTDFDEDELNISQQRVSYTIQIAIIDKMVRRPRDTYEDIMDLVDCTKVALKKDLTVDGAFKDIQFGSVELSPVTLRNESEQIPFLRVFMNDIRCWRVEEI